MVEQKISKIVWAMPFTKGVIHSKKILNALNSYAWNGIYISFNVFKM